MFGFGKKGQTAQQYKNFDYATREGREATVGRLFAAAKGARTAKEAEWVRFNDYYNFLHDVSGEVREAARESGITWDPAVVPDPFIMVESQIDPIVPEPEFRGRDDDMDSQKAKQREYAVKYVCQNNRLPDLNTANERRLKKLGDAFWKVYWDEEMSCGPYGGDIHVRDVPVEAIYPDPTAGADGLQAGQYVDYVYKLHRVKFYQLFGRELAKLGVTAETLISSQYQEKGGLFDLVSAVDGDDDTIQVLEHWFKHPVKCSDAEAGGVGCSIQAGGHEVKYIPNYWAKTGRQNQLFPFVHYWCVRDENEFYNKSEILPILPMVDAADRALANGLLNDAFTANDIILVEENAMADGAEFSNVPGAIVKVRQNAIGKVARLGGLNDGRNCLSMVEWWMAQIQRTNRNYETNQGKAGRNKTATELSMMRSDVDGQMEIKKADRNAGFMRLYQLIDWTALEFFDDDRIIFLGAQGPEEEPVVFRFSADSFAQTAPGVYDPMTMEPVREAYTYFPQVDVTVNAGDGVIRSKMATLEVLDKMTAVQATPDNYRLLSAQLEVLDIPQKQEIVEEWRKKFAPKVPPEITAALESDPELLGLVANVVKTQAAAKSQQGMPGGMGPLGGMGGASGGMPEMLMGGMTGVPM